ncbi:hypothetical protein [Thalassotalea atypica]|uniref:hypothetical protein n=1 Tax=Thalassotalea atypica TaxID=2054316 RepID=UPI0025734B57|nr:hypothetical protein [Thalassotalea atypica]
MKNVLILFLSIIALSGCDAIQTPIAESNYQSALSSGNLTEQLRFIDELSSLDIETYGDLAAQKEKLLPFLLQIMDKPKNLTGISDDTLKEIIKFSPNNSSFSFIRKYISDKEKLASVIKENLAALAQEKQFLVDKMKTTPSHVNTYETNMKLEHIKPYLLLSQYIRSFNSVHGDKSLNGFQIEAIAKNFATQFQLNEQVITSIVALNAITTNDNVIDKKAYSEENKDIAQVLLWLYKKQLIAAFQHMSEQNKYLLSLLSNQLGRQSLDEVWSKKVEPVAKKIVMQSKESHLNVMNMMSAHLAKMSKEYPRFSHIYLENDRLEKLMLSLVWPSDGLANFEQTSKANIKALWLAIDKKQQL